jgi:hypothetical protein
MTAHYNLTVSNCSPPKDTIKVTAPCNEHLISTFDASDTKIVKHISPFLIAWKFSGKPLLS